MSAIVAAAGPWSEGAATARVRLALGTLGAYGAEPARVGSAATGRVDAALAAVAHDWERTLRLGTAEVVVHGALTVAADATLHHRADLCRALGVPATPPPTDAMLAALAYARWGEDGFARLEGDFALVLWDAAAGRLVAARSFTGSRALYVTRSADGVVVATTVEALLADPRVPRTLDRAAIAAVAAGLWGHAPRTAYAAIDEVPAGHRLTWDVPHGVRTAPFWHPGDDILMDRAPLDTAAEALRALLVDAVRERLAPEGPTALSLSGGWDSTAVGGAATVALGAADAARLRPVSISYPAGDPGREDELIQDVVAHWGIRTRWLDVDDITLLPDPGARAAVRSLPFAHLYEEWNRALALGARAEGARVMLDGVGGDQLFQVSDILLSDLFGRGRWLELARQWKARGGRGLANVWRWAVKPALPPVIPRVIARVRGLPPPTDHLHRRAPFWVRADGLEATGVLAREAAAAPALPRRSRVLAETHAYLRYAFFARVMAALRGFALEEGVALRSPLLDDRVVRFAARRPWSERSDGRETKILLRRAMRGLLPAHVLAPRPHRTGVTSAYFLRQLRGPARADVEAMLAVPRLAEWGLVDATLLRRAWEHVLRHDDDETGARLFFTLQADLWTRAHDDAAAPVTA